MFRDPIHCFAYQVTVQDNTASNSETRHHICDLDRHTMRISSSNYFISFSNL